MCNKKYPYVTIQNAHKNIHTYKSKAIHSVHDEMSERSVLGFYTSSFDSLPGIHIQRDILF